MSAIGPERVLEVLKLRGSDYASGQHGYRLSGDGLDVFPRLADDGDDSAYVLGDRAASRPGWPLLDEMLGDGYWPGAATLSPGRPGSARPSWGCSSSPAGRRRASPGIIASLQENPTQLAARRRARSPGRWTAPVEIMYRSPVEL